MDHSSSIAIFVLSAIVVCFCDARSWNLSKSMNRPTDRLHRHSAKETHFKTGDIINITDASGATRSLYVSGHTPVFTDITSRAGTTLEAVEDGEMCSKLSSLEGHLGQRSICPYETYLDRNATRVPSDIVAVRCKCHGKCQSPTGPATCQRVFYNVMVQKLEVDERGQTKGGEYYPESVPVACICAN